MTTPLSAPETTLHLAYAEASIMLIECLMLTLVEQKVVPLETLIDAVETAVDTKRALTAENVHPQVANVAAGVLARMANSLAAARKPPQ